MTVADLWRNAHVATLEGSTSYPLTLCDALLPGGDVVIAGGYDDGNENTGGIWRFQQ